MKQQSASPEKHFPQGFFRAGHPKVVGNGARRSRRFSVHTPAPAWRIPRRSVPDSRSGLKWRRGGRRSFAADGWRQQCGVRADEARAPGMPTTSGSAVFRKVFCTRLLTVRLKLLNDARAFPRFAWGTSCKHAELDTCTLRPQLAPAPRAAQRKSR